MTKAVYDDHSLSPDHQRSGIEARPFRRVKQLVHKVAVRAAYGIRVRYMYDDYSGITIPSSARMVAGYTWWSASQWRRFRNRPALLIVTRANIDRGDVLDCEAGDATPSQCYGWIRMRKAAGYHRPTIYCNLSTVSAVRRATGHYRLGVDYDLWVASWTGRPHQAYHGAAATQYANVDNRYDLSVVYDSKWPHRKADKPKPKPPVKHIASGRWSIAEVAHQHNITHREIAETTWKHWKPGNKYRRAFTRYYDDGKSAHKKIPKGLTYFVPRGLPHEK